MPNNSLIKAIQDKAVQLDGTTRAVTPLDKTANWTLTDAPETFPVGI